MILLRIEGTPIPFSAPVKGKSGFYNPKYQVFKNYKIEVLSQYHGKVISSPVRVDYLYSFAWPTSFSKKKIKEIISNGSVHTKRPDLDNLDKLVSDILIGTIIEDDSLIFQKTCRKIYSNKAYTQIMIYPEEES